MHPHLLEVLTTEHVKKRRREAALHRPARLAGRSPRRGALTSAPAAVKESKHRLRGEQLCAEYGNK